MSKQPKKVTTFAPTENDRPKSRKDSCIGNIVMCLKKEKKAKLVAGTVSLLEDLISQEKLWKQSL